MKITKKKKENTGSPIKLGMTLEWFSGMTVVLFSGMIMGWFSEMKVTWILDKRSRG